VPRSATDWPAGVLCLLLYDDVDLSMDEIALATQFNKGHISRKIWITRRVLARVLRPDGETPLTEQLGDCEQPADVSTELTDVQWRRLSRLIKQNPATIRPAASCERDRMETDDRSPLGRPAPPPRFGSVPAAKRRYRIWKRDGTLETLRRLIGT